MHQRYSQSFLTTPCPQLPSQRRSHPHRNSDIGLLERRRVVDTVTCHTYAFATCLEFFYDTKFLFGGGTGEDDFIESADLLPVGFFHLHKVGAGEGEGVLWASIVISVSVVEGKIDGVEVVETEDFFGSDDTTLTCDGFGSELEVAGDHEEADSGATAGGDDGRDFRTRRVDDADETDDGEIIIGGHDGVFKRQGRVEVVGTNDLAGEKENTLTARRPGGLHGNDRVLDLIGQGHDFTRCVQSRRSTLEKHIRSSLSQQDLVLADVELGSFLGRHGTQNFLLGDSSIGLGFGRRLTSLSINLFFELKLSLYSASQGWLVSATDRISSAILRTAESVASPYTLRSAMGSDMVAASKTAALQTAPTNWSCSKACPTGAPVLTWSAASVGVDSKLSTPTEVAVMQFEVRVPVLSEQSTETAPSVSHVESCLQRIFALDIFFAMTVNESVTATGMPSGKKETRIETMLTMSCDTLIKLRCLGRR